MTQGLKRTETHWPGEASFLLSLQSVPSRMATVTAALPAPKELDQVLMVTIPAG